jgi:hypothetical protein
LRSKFNVVNPFGAAKGTTYPEKKSPHCVHVRLLRTSHNGLVRSVFSFFGRRFRNKYGAIGRNIKGRRRRRQRQEEKKKPPILEIETVLIALKYHFQDSR